MAKILRNLLWLGLASSLLLLGGCSDGGTHLTKDQAIQHQARKDKLDGGGS